MYCKVWGDGNCWVYSLLLGFKELAIDFIKFNKLVRNRREILH